MIEKPYSVRDGYTLSAAMLSEIFFDIDNHDQRFTKYLSLKYEISQDEIYEIVRIIGETHNNKTNWQRAVLRCGFAKNSFDVDQTTLSANDVLRATFDLLQFELIRFKAPNLPLLFMIDRLINQDQDYLLLQNFWSGLLKDFGSRKSDYYQKYSFEGPGDDHLYLPPYCELETLSVDENKLAKNILTEFADKIHGLTD